MTNFSNKISGSESSLNPFFQPNPHDQAQVHYRSYLAVLCILKCAPYDLHDDMTEIVSFLLRLGKLVGSRGQAKPKFLPSSSLLWTVLCIWACLRTDRTAMLLIWLYVVGLKHYLHVWGCWCCLDNIGYEGGNETLRLGITICFAYRTWNVQWDDRGMSGTECDGWC